jgi:hypothetical protein
VCGRSGQLAEGSRLASAQTASLARARVVGLPPLPSHYDISPGTVHMLSRTERYDGSGQILTLSERSSLSCSQRPVSLESRPRRRCRDLIRAWDCWDLPRNNVR